jgi:hypothetical protein
MVPPAEDELPPLAVLAGLEVLELELQAARTPGTATAPAAAASPLRADRLLNWGFSVEDVRFIATPCGSTWPLAQDEPVQVLSETSESSSHYLNR